MKIGDIVEYTDHRGAKHDAKVTRVAKQPLNIQQTEHEEIINVEYNAGGRVRIAELISKRPNTSGQCYGRVLKGDEEHDDTEAKAPEDDERDEDVGPEASSEADDEDEEDFKKEDTGPEIRDSDGGDDTEPNTTATEDDDESESSKET